MGENKNKLKKIREKIEDEAINLRKFLKLYYGISIEPYDFKISHEDVIYLIPTIEKVSLERILIEEENIYSNDIITVKDSYNKVVFYKRPVLENYLEIRTIECTDYSKSNIIETAISLEKLNKYKLVQLMNAYKSANRLKEYRIAYRILQKKKEKNKQKEYKRENNNLIKRGMIDYD